MSRILLTIQVNEPVLKTIKLGLCFSLGKMYTPRKSKISYIMWWVGLNSFSQVEINLAMLKFA